LFRNIIFVFFREFLFVITRGCAKGARAHPLEKKWLEKSTGLTSFPTGGPHPWKIPGYAPGNNPFL
jgi:hypothetical protein